MSHGLRQFAVANRITALSLLFTPWAGVTLVFNPCDQVPPLLKAGRNPCRATELQAARELFLQGAWMGVYERPAIAPPTLLYSQIRQLSKAQRELAERILRTTWVITRSALAQATPRVAWASMALFKAELPLEQAIECIGRWAHDATPMMRFHTARFLTCHGLPPQFDDLVKGLLTPSLHLSARQSLTGRIADCGRRDTFEWLIEFGREHTADETDFCAMLTRGMNGLRRACGSEAKRITLDAIARATDRSGITWRTWYHLIRTLDTLKPKELFEFAEGQRDSVVRAWPWP